MRSRQCASGSVEVMPQSGDGTGKIDVIANEPGASPLWLAPACPHKRR